MRTSNFSYSYWPSLREISRVAFGKTIVAHFRSFQTRSILDSMHWLAMITCDASFSTYR
ncbi:hypothetical protein BRCON_2786 [Candidatus Sumerlaea chitinivorans]|uniref:Uncharacterized protein n=1 Tax=Sumerlaea chitinivorans TaxID=2250252 RepID=A0A2Z4Y9M5_SUMC1|nr:hypothetical protein BRCON_2786 [Candidatus Sumerlaea chitinivorans]